METETKVEPVVKPSIISRVYDAIRAAGETGVGFQEIWDIQKQYGHSKNGDSMAGAVGSIVARLSRRRLIYTDRSARPYRYKIATGTAGSETGRGNGGTSKRRELMNQLKEEKGATKNPLAFGWERGLESAVKRFLVDVRTLVDFEVSRRLKGEIRKLVENL